MIIWLDHLDLLGSKIQAYMALGSIGVLVYMVGFPAVIGTAVLYMHRHGLHTEQSWIDMLGWVCAHNLILVRVLAAPVPVCVVLAQIC